MTALTQAASIRQESFIRLPLFLLFFVLLFTTQMSFRPVDFAERSVDIQVIVRLLVLGGVFLLMLPQLGRFFRAASQLHLFLHLLLLVYLALVSFSGDGFNAYSYYGLATHLTLFFVIWAFVQRQGFDATAHAYYLSVILFCAVSLVYYYVFPEIGRYTYWTREVLLQSTRMQGVGGHPNTLGIMAGTGLLVLLHMLLNRLPIGRLAIGAGLLIVFCLILTQSRTNMMVTLVTGLLYIAMHRRSVPLLVALVAGVALLLVFFGDAVTSMLLGISRSGNIEEIITFTGRTHIWDYVYQMFTERPYFGWGHATGSAVLAEHSDRVGFTVGQAHSLYLQMLFSGGIFGALIFALGVIAALWLSLATRNRLAFCLLLYILLVGVTETVILATVANNAYLVFSLALAGIGAHRYQSVPSAEPPAAEEQWQPSSI